MPQTQSNLLLLLPLVVMLSGCAAATRPAVPALAAPSGILSDEQLAQDDAKHLPTDNEVGRIDPVGDLLVECAGNDPKNPELQWFLTLSPKMREEVIGELNQYVFVLNDKLLVKARLNNDDYDMRWRFAEKGPSRLQVIPPKEPSGKSKTLQVSALDVQTIPAARDTDDARNFKARFVWQIDPNIAWNSGEKLFGTSFQFTLPLDYKANCWIVNRVVRRVDSLDAIESLELQADGRAKLIENKEAVASEFALRLALNGEGPLTTVVAKPGDTIATYLPDALGAGANWYKYLGVYNGFLRFEENSSFYNIMPNTLELLEVPPYDHPPKEKAAATQAGGAP